MQSVSYYDEGRLFKGKGPKRSKKVGNIGNSLPLGFTAEPTQNNSEENETFL